MQPRVDSLRKCLGALAEEAEVQLKSLAEQGLVPPEQYIDELVLDFDSIAAAAPAMEEEGEIDSATCECLRELNDYLSAMSGKLNAQLWTVEALRTAKQWVHVRMLARRCLSSL